MLQGRLQVNRVWKFIVLAPKSQARNSQGQFVCQEKEISVNNKEATATIFAAAASTHMSESPGLYPAEWTSGAKTNNAAILTLATKMRQMIADEAQEPQSPADVLRRLNLGAGPSTPSRKRQATMSLIEEDEDDRVYKTAPKFGDDNPFASTAKKLADTGCSDKANPASVATVLETKNFYVEVTTFMSKFGAISNLEFEPRCPAMVDLLSGRPIQRDHMLNINGKHVAVVFVYNKYTTATLVPYNLLAGLNKAVGILRAFNQENKTNYVPVSFMLHGILRINRNFEVTKIRFTEDDRINRPATIKVWKAKYSNTLTFTSQNTMCSRVAGLIDYVKKHGIVKCHAPTDHEVDQITAGVADDAMSEIWGPAGNPRVGGRADEID